MLDNHVIAYGIDANGDFSPLSATTSADFSGFASLRRQYSNQVAVIAGVAAVQNLVIPDAVGKRLFLHSVEITFSEDAAGEVPIGNTSGMFGTLYAAEFSIFDGYNIIDIGGGSISDLLNTLDKVVTARSGFPDGFIELWSGSIKLNSLIEDFQTGDVTVITGLSTNFYGAVRFIYSIPDQP